MTLEVLREVQTVKPAGSVAFMLPGLGDHYLGMGLGLYRELPVFREWVDRCARLLEPELGLDIRGVMHPEGVAPPPASQKLDLRKMLGREARARTPEEQRLDETQHAQPALFVIELALAKQWQAWGVTPAAMIGYSLGEYVAACLAGVLSLEDALVLVARRARLIATLPRGAMLAIMLPVAEIEPLLGGELSLCAVNGPEFCVAGGPPGALDALDERLRARRATVRRVQTTHAFHSKMMDPIAEEVTRLAQTFQHRAPAIPYVSNVTGALITAEEATDPSYWAKHLRSPVQFARGLGALNVLNVKTLLEVGPGQTLSSLVPPSSGRAVVPSMRHALDPDPDGAVLARAAGSLGRRPDAGVPAARALTKTEKELAAIWQTILKCELPGPDANFFKSGGNSLSATRLIDRTSRTFRIKLPLKRVYQAATLEAMAAAIDGLRGGASSAVEPSPEAAKEAGTIRLPNGLWVAHQNEAETRHFYDDIFAHRSYVKHGIRIPDGGVVLDVGGNIGLFTLFAHGEARDVRIFTFEPAPPLCAIIRRNVADHGVKATVLEYGLSNCERQAPFTFYPHSAGMSSFHPDLAEERRNLEAIIGNQRLAGDDAATQMLERAEELLEVRFAAVEFTAKLRRLSDVLREQAIGRVDLMKVDVQKCELEVIEGIDAHDWSKFSQIVLEAHDVDGRVAHLERIFRERGFSVVVEQDELYRGTNIFNVYAVRAPLGQGATGRGQ